MTPAVPTATPQRRVASNLLWSPEGVRRHPLVTLDGEGRVLEVTFCDEPDRLASTEFYAGMMILDFPQKGAALLTAWKSDPEGATLEERLRSVVPASSGRVAILSGLCYEPLALTQRTALQLL